MRLMHRPLAALAVLAVVLLGLPGAAAGCSGSLPWSKVPEAAAVVVGTVVAADGDPQIDPVVRLRVEEVLKGSVGPELQLEGVRGHVCGDFIYADPGTRMVIALGIPYPDFRPPDEPIIAAWWAEYSTGEVVGSADLPAQRMPRSLAEVMGILRSALPDTATADPGATEGALPGLLTVTVLAACAAGLRRRRAAA
jgi:hypothetical protein